MLSEIVLLAMLTSLVDDWRFFDDRGALNGVRKVGSNANEKKLSGCPFALNTRITCRAAFSDGVDWSAILIYLWEAPGWLMSELGRASRASPVHTRGAQLYER